MTDVPSLERHLSDLSSQTAQQGTDDSVDLLWNQVESTAQALADALRSREGPGKHPQYTHIAHDINAVTSLQSTIMHI